MLTIISKILGLGGFLDGYKTIIGATLKVLVLIATQFPQFSAPMDSLLASINHIGDVLFSVGIVHWKIKDILSEQK